MVRNTKGGNKSKKQARKFSSQPKEKFIRYADEVDEIYACVTKYYGSGMVDVACMDGVNRLCIIRKKFKGRNKRDNSVSIGTYVLVGLRSWEVVEVGKKRKCDLLEIYSKEDIMQIKKYMTDSEWANIVSVDDTHKDEYDDENGIAFTDEKTQRYEDMTEDSANEKITLKQDSAESKQKNTTEEVASDDEINVDDI